MFSTACDQVKELDYSLLRPEKPRGTEPHIAFEIVFKNEHVVGEAGPYR
jgi:other hect domain ubiquitin protein ligase E3